ncbi:MAG: response regulator [Verrucomicrobiota bacterium]
MSDSHPAGQAVPPRGKTQPHGEQASAPESVQSRKDHLAHIRHDLRTPINAILGYSELLQEEASELGLVNFLPGLRQMHGGGKQLLILINEYFDAARVDTWRNDLPQVRQELITPLNHVVEANEQLQAKATDRNDAGLLADLKKIHTACSNLQELFARHLTPTEGEPGEPAAVDKVAATAAEGTEEMDVELHGALSKYASILVVDDNENNRDMITRRLQREGYSIVTAGDGKQALDLLRSGKFNLVLLDMMMPIMNGYEVLDTIKGDPALREIPVIMISALDELKHAVKCIEKGAEDYLLEPFEPVMLKTRVGACLEKKRLRDQEVLYLRRIEREKKHSDDLVNVVIPIGISLMKEPDFNRLLEKILMEAKNLCQADGGTLYLMTERQTLKFAMLRNDSLNIAMGGTTGKPIPFPELPLHDPKTGDPNHHYVATHVALTGKSINIADAYQADGFDFSGTKEFDARTGYRSRSFLTVPLKNTASDVIGVLQLLNAQSAGSRKVTPFDPDLQQAVESLSALAAAALETYQHTQALREQLVGLRNTISKANGKESPEPSGSSNP